MTRRQLDTALRWIALVFSYSAGFLTAMWVAPAHAQECEVADPQSRTISWDAPTECNNGDTIGTTAECPALDGFRIHIGTAAGTYTDVVDVTNSTLRSFVLDCLEPRTTHFLAMTAYSPSGESDFSGEITFTTGAAQSPPNPPTNLTVLEDDLVAYTVVKSRNRLALVAVGTVPPGTECDGTQGANGMYVVPVEAVDWAGTVRTEVVVARCN